MSDCAPHATAVILVEDDIEIGELISKYLSKYDINVTILRDGSTLDRYIETQVYNLIILDVNLPGEDGLSICRRIRASNSIPIIFLTARSEDVDKILGLEMGADDYLVKPFNPRELLARIRAILRRLEPSGSELNTKDQQILTFSNWTLNLMSREVISPEGTKISMTGGEFDLLYAFCESPNRIISRDQLITMTHGNLTGPYERSIDVLISRLRQKIEKDPKNPIFIKTVRAEGYLFSAQVSRK
jgi:two-component system, OmpR family, response regulator